MATATVDEALARLDAIIESALRVGSPSGYFAAMYRTVTAKVGEGIGAGFFDDAERMERLTVVFADLYFGALDAHARGARPPRSWQVAFDALASRRPLIVQHLLAGINAHINLDLGIAAARVAPGAALPGLRRDFDRINGMLALQVDELGRRLSEVSPWMRLLGSGGRTDDVLVRFSITAARTHAWRFAAELAPVPADSWGGAIEARDVAVARLGRRVLYPGLPLAAKLLLVRAREQRDVRANLRVLSGLPGPDLAAVDAHLRTQGALLG